MGISHVTLGTNDPARSRTFYAAVVGELGGSIVQDVPDRAFCCGLADNGMLWLTRPYDGEPATVGNGVTIALAASSAEAVDAAYAAGIGAGGSSEGEPGPRPHYGPDVYVAYLRDPDGNKVALAHYRTSSASDM